MFSFPFINGNHAYLHLHLLIDTYNISTIYFENVFICTSIFVLYILNKNLFVTYITHWEEQQRHNSKFDIF